MALDALNILEHQQDKFGVVTVIDATLYDLVSGEPILELDTLKMANITTEASEKEIRGGQAATQLIIYDYGRTATMEMQDALGSLASMQYMWGSTIATGNDVFKHIKFPFTVAEDDTITVPGIVPNGTKVTVVYLAEGASGASRTLTTVTSGNNQNVSVDGSVSTITTPTEWNVDATDVVTVYAEIVAPGADAKALTLTSSGFSNNIKLVGKTFVIDQASGVRKAAELVIHNFKLNPTFELMFDSEGEAAVFDFSGRALEDANGRFITMTYLDEDFA
jgi:hypothetical protein